jgi:hypothetical protein
MQECDNLRKDNERKEQEIKYKEKEIEWKEKEIKNLEIQHEKNRRTIDDQQKIIQSHEYRAAMKESQNPTISPTLLLPALPIMQSAVPSPSEYSPRTNVSCGYKYLDLTRMERGDETSNKRQRVCD